MNPEHYLFVDERLLGNCAFCGGMPGTRDHVPSKVLLDDPLPPNLPIVESCAKCNQGFSLDEVYLACFLECVIVGSTDLTQIRRVKIKRALEHNPKLARQIEAASTVGDDGILRWGPEAGRIQNVVMKLARGHVAYELCRVEIDEPTYITCIPLSVMSVDDRAEFENAGAGELRGWPEIGSRAYLRAAGAEPFQDSSGPWIVVQSGQYRYSVDEDGGVRVQIVIAEYLACIVVWE
jgi:hypothetical protein